MRLATFARPIASKDSCHMPAPARRTMLAATSLLALGSAAPAGAQTAIPTQSAGQRSEEIIVVQAKKRNQTQVLQSLDVPFSIKSYTAALILNQQPQTLGQVLENDPSVRTTNGYGNASELFLIRGFPLDGDDVGIDGLYGVAPRQLISPELYDQVQVLDGANAFLNGAAPGGSGIGGGVNLIMKQAADAPLTRVTGSYASDSLGGGAVDLGRRYGDNNQFGVRINASGTSGGTTLDHEHRDSVMVGGGFDWRSEVAHVSLDLGYQDKGIDFGRSEVFLGAGVTSIPKVPSNTRNYGEPWSFTRLKDLFGVLHADYTILADVTLYADVGGRDGSENGTYTSLTLANAATGAATASFLGVPRTDDNESTNAGIRAKFQTGPISHEINIGGSGLWEVGRYAYTFGPSVADNLYNLVYAKQPAILFSGGNVNDPYPIDRVRLWSVYGSDTISAFDGRAQLIIGVREQNILVRGYSYGGGGLDSSYDASKATPVVGVVLHPTPQTAVYFNRIEGLAQGPIAPSGTTNAGELFPPYDSVQYEVGAKYQRANFATSLAFYQIEQPNAYEQSTASGIPTYVVDGIQRNRGIEWTISGEIAHGLRVIGGATLTNPALQNTGSAATDGNKAIGIPDYTVNANLEYDLPFLLGGTVTGRVIRTGIQQVDNANALQLPGWTRFDLGARYTFLVHEKPVTARFGVDNIADKRYWESAYGGYLLQGDGRTFKLSLSVDL
jgi:iron complex outermembrane receptor protein